MTQHALRSTGVGIANVTRLLIFTHLHKQSVRRYNEAQRSLPRLSLFAGPAARVAPRRVFTVRADKSQTSKAKGGDMQADKPEQG